MINYFDTKALQKQHDEFYTQAIYKKYEDYDIVPMSPPIDRPYFLNYTLGKKTAQETLLEGMKSISLETQNNDSTIRR